MQQFLFSLNIMLNEILCNNVGCFYQLPVKILCPLYKQDMPPEADGGVY